MEPLDPRDPAFIGPYRLLARLGEGGMGRVYLGMSAGRRVVAVKVIHADHARDQEFRKRFKIEVAAARRVQAAFTAPVIDAAEDEDPPWLVTSLVAGPSLADVIKSQGPLPSGSVWRLVAGLAEALAAVHACGIVHRDVTPGNVLLAIDGPRLIDFGLARALGSSNMTATGIVIGTPAFLSPEHVRGDPVGPASDIFSLGSLMVFAATGAGPFGSGEPIEVIGRIGAGEPDFRGLRGRLMEVAAACLAREPADRPVPAEIIQSVPGDSALLADSPATQFWPAPLDAFIRSYEASFSVVVPDPSSPGQQSTLPLKHPKEIAAEAVSLIESGQQDGARLLLAAAAASRPDQEVAALIALLRAKGRHAEAEVVTKAAARRPALEIAALAGILWQIGSDADANNLLDQAADGSAEHVGAIVAALAGAGQTNEMRRLMRAAASTAPRQPQGIVTLVGVLSSAGLGQDVTRLMDMVTALVSPAQAAALGDAMRVSGHREAAFSLYSAAVDAVALRPPDEIASVLRFMREAKQDDLANRLIEALTVAHRETADVIQLAAALSTASLDGDSRQVLAAAAATMPVAGVIEIAESLLAMNQQEAALSVCAEAAAKDPAATGAFADALRDMGRPVDAYRLLESLGTRTVRHAAEVIASLRAAGRSDDADRVLREFLRQGPEPVCDLLARLEKLGVSEDGSRVAALLDPGMPDLLSELASSLIKRQAYTVADHLLARAAQESAPCCCELIDRTLRPPPIKSRLPTNGSNFPAPERTDRPGRRPQPRPVTQGPDSDLFALHWQAHHGHGGLLSCLRSLRGERLGVAAHEMLSYAAHLPIAEVVRFARELDWADGPDAGRQTRAAWSGTSEAAALIAATARRTTSDVGVVLQALLDQPNGAAIGRQRLAATNLLSTITEYPDDVIVTVAMGLNSAVPDLLAIFARITAGILSEILAGNPHFGKSGLPDIYAELLKAAGANLPAADFCHLYLDLREKMLCDEAGFLLKEAAMNPETPEIIVKMKGYGLRREAKQLGIATRHKNG
jgi:serine/threonine protein kinase